ncbi:MAG: hypothetical protein IKZ66_01270, partial [Schwartzia sp.]|nr:hypothetical protein [Schwartzia sp. (in: firmicutes)]
PFEEFRTVYRFLRRTMGIFGKPISILRFSLPNGTDEKTMEAFFSLLCSTLRTADVATKNGGHCLVLLVNTSFPNLAHAADRLRKKWTEMEIEEGMEADFEYEWTVMEP